MKKKTTFKDIWSKIAQFLTFGSFIGGCVLIIVGFFLDENLLLMGIGMGLLVLWFICTQINNAVLGDNTSDSDQDSNTDN